jgi:hypothetical protein
MPQQEPSAWLALEMLERAARRYLAARSEDNHAQLTDALEVAQEAIKAREAWI